MIEQNTQKKEAEHLEASNEVTQSAKSHLKMNGRGVILNPQPSNDPNDPLNWSKFEKYSTYLPVCFFTILATMNASNFTVAIKLLSAEFGQSTTSTGYLVCFNVLLLGLGNIIWVPLMRVIGKRPVYLIALVLFIATNVWSGQAHSFNSLLASRIVSGFAASASDATVPSLVTDLFFTHERGHHMMIFHLALSAGFFLGPVVCAWVTQEVGWRWTCHMLAVAGAATLLPGIFTIRETSYPHRRMPSEDQPAETYPPKRSYAAELSVTRGYNPEGSFFKTFSDIIVMMAYPPIIWTGFTVGAFVGWNIVVQLTAAQSFSAPPYKWTIGNIGLLGFAGFIGALLAFFVGGKLIDIIATRMTMANGGMRRPEFRLPAIVVPAVIGPMGVLTFGLCAAHKTAWIGPAFGFGMEGFGLTAVSNVAVTYAVDGYQELSGEALVVVFVIRNTIGTILALYTTDWQAKAGIANTFGQMVGIQYFLILLVIPMYFYGFKIRHWTTSFGPAKHTSMAMTNERTGDLESVSRA